MEINDGGKKGEKQEGIEEEMERGRKGAVTYRILVICWSIYHICYREKKKVCCMKTYSFNFLVAHNITVHILHNDTNSYV